jgi:hypothetical protein
VDALAQLAIEALQVQAQRGGVVAQRLVGERVLVIRSCMSQKRPCAAAASAASAAAGARGCRSGSGMWRNTKRSQPKLSSRFFTTG